MKTPLQLFQVPAPPMLVEGIIPEHAITTLVSPGGLGKTWFALEIALSVASGTPAFGKFVSRQARVLYCGEDAPEYDIASQLRRLYTGRSWSPDFLEENFQEYIPSSYVNDDDVYHAPGFISMPSMLCDIGTGAALDSDKDTQALISFIIRESIGLLILDSLSDHHHGDENSNSDMARVMARLKALRQYCSILVLHHTAKPSGDSPRFGSQSSRGASKIGDATDGMLKLYRKNDCLHIKVVKARSARLLDFSYVFNPSDDEAHFVIADDTTNSTSASVVHFLSTRPGASPKEVMEFLKLEQPDWPGHEGRVNMALSHLRAAGTVIKPRYGYYTLANRSTP